MTKKDAEVFLNLEIQLLKARTKHRNFPVDAAEALSIISEEYLELNEAMLAIARGVNENHPREHLIEEAYHVAVTAIRFIQLVEK